jgi:predicted aspartyl protease
MVQRFYQVQRQGNLMTLRAYVADGDGVYQGIRLLIDTGATYTVLPVGFLNTLGYDVAGSTQKVQIAAAGGMLQVPRLVVRRFSCLGCVVDDLSVVALSLPIKAGVNGLLGMDFLARYGALIDTGKAAVWMPD